MYIDPEDFQKYIYNEKNRRKYRRLSPEEQVRLYFFEHLDDNDQRTLLGYIWSKINLLK